MRIDPTTLFIIWFGGGFVIFLAWAALMGEALLGERPQAVCPAIGMLAIAGIFHPAAALSAVDLVRLSRTLGTDPGDGTADASTRDARRVRAASLALPRWAEVAVYGCAVASVLIAIAAFVGAGGLP